MEKVGVELVHVLLKTITTEGDQMLKKRIRNILLRVVATLLLLNLTPSAYA